jgi:ferredoxin-type protein NapH
MYGSIILLVIITGVTIITLISMPGLIISQIADSIMFKTIGIEIFLLLVILIIEVIFAPRFWCKYACPVGATLALFHTKRSLRISYNSKHCNNCAVAKDRVCNITCPLNLNPRGDDIYPYCYNCMECVDICQKSEKALNISFNKK